MDNTTSQAGSFPRRSGRVRFAVGSPDGLTSNSWVLWATKHGDVYVACRDNFREAKLSLHTSGRWRFGFTTEAIEKNSNLLTCNQNRAWEVWDRPPEVLPKTVIAFRLLFPTSELTIRPDQRIPSQWKNVIHIEAAPAGKVTVFTLFITIGDFAMQHESEPSFCLASLNIGAERHAQLVAHGDPEGQLPKLIDDSVVMARREAENFGIELPSGAFGYFFGHQEDGSRFLVGAKLNRSRGQ